MAPSTTGMAAAATSSRETALLIRGYGSSAAEPAAPLRVLRECGSEVACVEVRPQPVDEHELRIRQLPQHEVRDAQLPARADQEIQVGQLRRVQVRRQNVLVDLTGIETAL